MSSIKSVNTINRQIERLNLQYDAMVKATEDFTKCHFDKENLFKDYAKYHSLFMDFSNNLITKNPFLPNNTLQANNQAIVENPSNIRELADLLQNNSLSFGKVALVGAPVIGLFVLTAIHIVPWLIPVLFSIGGIAFLGAPQLIGWYINYIKNKDDEDLPIDSTNPSEWISHDLQVISDKYDAIRILIFAQDRPTEKLAAFYNTKNSALYRRGEQEAQFFPNEALTIIRKINVFCTNAYYEIMDDLISHLPVSNVPSPQPQFPSGASAQ